VFYKYPGAVHEDRNCQQRKQPETEVIPPGKPKGATQKQNRLHHDHRQCVKSCLPLDDHGGIYRKRLLPNFFDDLGRSPENPVRHAAQPGWALKNLCVNIGVCIVAKPTGGVMPQMLQPVPD